MNDLHFAVCIGIDRYPGFPGRDLSSATRDAEAFRDWLIAPGGGALPEANVELVTAKGTKPFARVSDARPNVQRVLDALLEINERITSRVKANPDDWARTRLYIYAAGHGIAVQKNEGAVLMADARPELLTFNVDLSLYAHWYMSCGLVHEVVVFVDCCREVAAGMQPAFLFFNHCDERLTSEATIRFVAYATRWGEKAWEPIAVADPDRARGYFTEALIDGLNGAAEEEGTRQVTAASLATYVTQAVEKKTKPPVAPFPQRAEMPVDLGARLVLRDAPAAVAAASAPEPRPATTHVATIHFPAGFQGDVVIRSGDGVERGRWRARDGDWQITLPDSFYQVLPEPPAAVKFTDNGLFSLVGADADVDL